MAVDVITQIAVVVIAGLAVFFLWYAMGKKSPELIVLEQQLESLYHEVEGEKDLLLRTEKSETSAGVTLLHVPKKLPSRNRDKQKNRFLIRFLLCIFYLFALVFIMAITCPAILHDCYSYISYKVYPPTVKSVEVPPLENITLKGRAESLSVLPVTSSVKKNASAKTDAKSSAVPPVPSFIVEESALKTSVQPMSVAKKSSTNLNPRTAAVSPVEVKKINSQAKELLTISLPRVKKNGRYAVQIRAFPETERKDAMAFTENLKKTQPDVYVERVKIRKRGVWYRILTGHFGSIDDASNYMKEKKISEAYPDIFVQLKSAGRSPRTKPE